MNALKKLTWIIPLLILFFGALATISTFYFTRKQFITQVSSNLAELTQSESYKVNYLFAQSLDLAAIISERPQLKSYFLDLEEERTDKSIDESYLSGFNLRNMYSTISVADKKGTIILSSATNIVGEDTSHRNYYKTTSSGHRAFEIVEDADSAEFNYFFASPIRSPQKEVIGSVILKLRYDYLKDLVVSSSNSRLDTILLDENGIIIFSKNDDDIFKTVTPQTAINTDSLPYNLTKLVDHRYTLGSPLSSITTTPTTNKVQLSAPTNSSLISIVKLSDFPVYVVSESSYSLINRLAFNSSSIIAGFVALAAIITMVIVILISKLLISRQEQNDLALLTQRQELERINKLMVNRELRMVELKNQLKSKGNL